MGGKGTTWFLGKRGLDTLVEKMPRSCFGKKSSEFRIGSCSFVGITKNEGGIESPGLFDIVKKKM